MQYTSKLNTHKSLKMLSALASYDPERIFGSLKNDPVYEVLNVGFVLHLYFDPA